MIARINITVTLPIGNPISMPILAPSPPFLGVDDVVIVLELLSDGTDESGPETVETDTDLLLDG